MVSDGTTARKRSLAGGLSGLFHWARGYLRLAAVGAGVIFRILCLAPRPAFVVALKDGKASVRRGKVHPRFLRSCEEIAADGAIPHGTITGVPRGRGVSLAFSRDVPEAAHQRFRNAWSLEA
jgi:hypothetical protein